MLCIIISTLSSASTHALSGLGAPWGPASGTISGKTWPAGSVASGYLQGVGGTGRIPAASER